MISIYGSDGKIDIEILGYQNASASCKDDCNWLDCKISVVFSDVVITARCAIQTYDIIELYEKLKVGNRTFKWTLPENDASLEFVINERTVSHIKFVWRQKIGEEMISASTVIQVGRASKEICCAIQQLVEEFPGI